MRGDCHRLLATEDEKKAEVLDAIFVSVFNSQTSCPWEDRDKEQKEVAVIQEETVTHSST